MDGSKVGGQSPEQARSTTERLVDLEENARKFAAGQAAGCDERRLTPIHAPTVRESLQQQLQYHCNEIRRILDLKDHTPHVILEMPASKLRTLHVTIS
jgi:hypothetical protein